MENNILKYNDFLLNEYYSYIDSISLNESTTDSITTYLKNVLNKIKNLSVERKKSILIYSLSSLLLFTNADKILSVMHNDHFIKSQIVNVPDLNKVALEKLSKFKDVSTLKISKKGIENIKVLEGNPKHPGKAVLKAYKLGDGMVTVGWGHAERIGKSKFRVGQHITKEVAEKLLAKDVDAASDGVQSIFQDWKEEGIDVKITQDQFDVLVSMAMNMGITGLRKSEVIQQIKSGNLKKAGETIKSTSVSSKFNGLAERRKQESDTFLTAYSDEENNKPSA